MLKGLFIVFFSSLILLLPAQQYFEGSKVVKYRISSETLNENLPGLGIFRTMGIENNRGVEKLYLEVNIRLGYRVYRNDADILQLSINSEVVDIIGDINIKDFNIDSLLYPSDISIDFNIYNGRHKIGEKSIDYEGYGKTMSYDLSDFNNSIGQFKIEPNKIELFYSENDLSRFQETVELIKQYYSYNSLLDYYNSTYEQYSLVSGESTEKIALHRIEVELIKAYIDKLGKFTLLGLSYRDPLYFVDKLELFNRYYNRYVTLFDDIIVSDAGFDNHFLICNDLVSTNNKLLKHSEKIQPAEAIAFIEVSSIPDNIELESIISTIVYKYEQGNTKTGQCIIDKYINTGLEWKNKNHLNFALVNLNNAFLISNWLNQELNSNYYSLYQEIMGGLVSSFLKVGKMAIVNGKVDYGLSYVNKGIMMLRANIDAFKGVKSINDSFLELLELNNNIAIELIEVGYFNDAYQINKLNRTLCAGNSAATCYKTDSVHKLISHSFIRLKIDEAYQLIQDGQFPDAISVYDQIIDSTSNLNDISNYNRINELANFLSDTIFFQSQVLLKAQQSELALEKLLLASNILNKSGLQSDIINTTLITVSEEAILEILSKAKYAIWKNELDVANEHIRFAQQLSSMYLVNRSSKVNNKFYEIEQYLGTRVCIDIQNSYNDAIKKITLGIRDKNYHNIIDLVTLARTYLSNYKQCDLDSNLISSLELRNRDLFNYLAVYDKIKKGLVNHDYDQVIANYMKLKAFYNENYQNLKGIRYNDLNEFLLIQNLHSLTMAAVKYYIDINDPESALVYLKMAMKQGVDQNDNKEMIEQLASQLAKNDRINDISVNSALDKYTDNMEQKSFFRLSYLRNRYFKSQKE